MKQKFYFFSLFTIIILCITGCKKDNDYSIEGKWKLERVYIFPNEYLFWFTIECSENNIIYDFQKNNKLLVTSSIYGNLQTKEYSYKCEGRNVFCTSIDYDDIQLTIGKGIFYGSVSQKYERMSLFSESSESAISVKPKKLIDEIDVILIEQDSLFLWYKEFIHLK